ncbi:MAG: hypothetical protein WDN08_01470 [Rhizomicrobium sp.]
MNVQRFDPTSVFSADEMAGVRGRSDLKGLWCVFHAWAVIGLAMAAYALWPNPLSFLAAVVVIGSRQLGLAILMHDAAHGVLMKTRWLNEWVGDWLCAIRRWAIWFPTATTIWCTIAGRSRRTIRTSACRRSFRSRATASSAR